MMRLARAAALAAITQSILHSPTMADANIATTSPQADTPGWLQSQTLEMSLENTRTPSLQYTLLPSTVNMGLNGTAITMNAIRFSGNLILATQSNFNQLGGVGTIAYLSCDDPDKNDNFNISPSKMLNQLMDTNLTAIILFSTAAHWCDFARNGGSSYGSIATMADKDQASTVLAYIKQTNTTLHAQIAGNATVPDTSGNGRSHSTVAMSVLYSITGLITLLFLAIIITGTVRAHRHPERYGPHSGFGRRPRQSRAKGIARAMLDTLPIVKFGNQEPAKADPELELESASGHATEHQENAVATGGLGTETNTPAKKEEARDKNVASDASNPENHEAVLAEGEGAIAESASAHDSTGDGEEHLGCSICTEDFTMGEDVRVLPCNHQFHPGCVDPWLVNVSGTCPLCRYDLQPGRHAEAANEESTAELPPPLTLEAEEGEPSSTRNRASRLFDMHRLRSMPQQERIAALREMRSSGNDQVQDGVHDTQSHADGEENGRAARLAAKLRDKFRIRTRAQA